LQAIGADGSDTAPLATSGLSGASPNALHGGDPLASHPASVSSEKAWNNSAISACVTQTVPPSARNWKQFARQMLLRVVQEVRTEGYSGKVDGSGTLVTRLMGSGRSYFFVRPHPILCALKAAWWQYAIAACCSRRLLGRVSRIDELDSFCEHAPYDLVTPLQHPSRKRLI
jgi:hypothetical protein